VVFLLGLIIALSMLEVNIGPLLAGLGVIGFVVGFALQNTLSNFAAGFMILLYRPYDIGDYVTAGGVSGTVDSMNLVSTTIKTPDNQSEIVPNGQIWGGTITNVTGNETRRIDFVFGIGYDDDIAKAQKVLEEIVASNQKVLQNPVPVIQVHELADSSVNFVCRPWVNTGDYWTVYWEITRAVKERFDAEGIGIPYPQQDVHVYQMNPSSSG
jgi:small conductance mechanosensitive channel